MEDRWRGGANGETSAEEGTVENRSHFSSPLKQIADSVVYKLVRVSCSLSNRILLFCGVNGGDFFYRNRNKK